MSHPDGGDGPAGDRPDLRIDGEMGETGGDGGSIVCPAAGAGKLPGQSCTCAAECATGFCADGICCTSACKEGCRTCAGTGSEGTCTNLPTGAPPGPGKGQGCRMSNASTCGLDGMCDGLGACRNWVAGTQCKSGSCEGDAVVNGGECDGTGQCRAGATVICVPATCDPSTGDCFDTCTSPSQCALGHACAGGSCGKRMKGMSCNSGDDCLSGYCADHICCNVACQGACVACNLPLRLGTCWPIDADLADPRGVCVDEGKPSCGHTGTCDGVGGCARYPRDTLCEPPSCSSNKVNTAGSCDGRGICQPPGLTDCHPFRCVAGACTSTCQTDADCDTGIACVAGTCGPKLNGQTCGSSDECVSNHCVDGVCCESACTGACRSCALPGSPGRCVATAAGNADPRGVCLDEKAPSCGRNGRCDGSGGCQKYMPGTACGTESCSGNVYTPAATCNASGQCVAGDALPCKPYVCNGSKCFSVCTSDAQCLSPNQCQDNKCGLVDDGAACDTPGQCKSGFCEQGTCCHTACAGPCRSCALVGSLGVCSNVPTSAVDPAGLCVDQGAMSCGTNGKCQTGGCQKYVAGTSCKDASCPAGTTSSMVGSTCDGVGVCVMPISTSCFPYICGANACRNACMSGADCSAPATCINGSCGLKPIGLACAQATECQSGVCAQGYCCQTACNGLCKSCGLSATLGTCSNVPNGSPDLEARCGDMGAASCSTDGFCDGNGACRLYGAGTSCAPPTCPATVPPVQTSGRTCDGRGVCQAATTLACAPYLCNGATACKAACTSDADCLPPNICDPATNKCGNKQRLGQPCSATGDCLTGATCVDGVCCSAAACGTCQACNVAGNAGNCTNVPLGTPEPHALCSPTPPCGSTGSCNGAGACQQAATSVSCGMASCTGSTYTPVSHCDGSGVCAAPTAMSCGAYVCGAGVCKTTCMGDADCVAPTTCQGAGNCALKPNGSTCAASSQCISGFCTNGVCCGSASCPTCQACNVNGLGSCAPLGAGTPAPAGQCPAAPPCGNTGACDGGGACQKSGTAATCGGASCSGSTYTPVAHCDGAGSCATATASTCAPYVCGGGVCLTACSGDADCVTGDYCTGSAGTCQPKKAAGAICGTAHECGNGLCTDGHCCGVASCPTCQACGAGGVCVDLPVGTLAAACTPGPPCGNTGACNGAGSCQKAASSVGCTSASCSGTTFTPAAFCNGAGSCGTPVPQSCAPYVCGSGVCKAACGSDGDCSAGNYCTGPGGSCVALEAAGALCTADHQCGTGHCTDGVCCTTAACGTCQACSVNGLGTCAPVSNLSPEPHNLCPMTTTCGDTGLCVGGACQKAPSSVSCGTASCSGATFTPAAFCTGTGSCAAPTPQSCGAYLCGAGACKTSCASDSDCATGSYCTGVGGSCVPLVAAGDGCTSDHQCGTGHCTDGVCCAVASCGTCKACSSSGNGTCTTVPDLAAEPHNLCPATTTCGNTGLCVGGACQQAASSVVCQAATCTSPSYQPPGHCTGGGSCSVPSPVDCTPFACSMGGCLGTCNGDGDCVAADYCSGPGGACAPRRANGQTCASDSQCTSSHCVEGFCCGTGACLSCQSCAVPGLEGTCSNVPTGGTDPTGSCIDQGAASCQRNGRCNGAGTCQLYDAATACSFACALDGSALSTILCDGLGTCGPGSTSTPCATFTCSPGPPPVCE